MTQINLKSNDYNVDYHIEADWDANTIRYFVGYKGKIVEAGHVRLRSDASKSNTFYRYIGELVLTYGREYVFDDATFSVLPAWPF